MIRIASVVCSFTTFLFCPLASVAAQITVQVALPISASLAASGPYTNSLQVPAGPASTSASYLMSVYTGASSSVAWALYPNGIYESGCVFSHSCGVQVTASGGDAVNSTHLLLTLTAPVPTPVRIEPLRDVVLSGAGQLPQFDIDFGNDGSIEITSSSALMPSHVVVGPQGLLVRIRTSASLLQPGYSFCRMQLRVVPDTSVFVTAMPIGCDQGDLFVGPLLAGTGGDVGWFGLNAYSNPQIAIVGLQAAPTTLPVSISQVPGCVVMPTVDVLFPLPAANSVMFTIPAAVRPFGFWTQAVTITPNGLRTGTACYVYAN